ncbi:leukemia inhibitory factor receptor isoform X1 [Megalobrama amblycephala]|uniref:leukemia inhibitory factor receptor isoform X1 n=1 Tax=Megalobrama amblycephala TaxID=75352 RepID=UPI002013CC49|nr:leukemia inhibitory factor receptor isoform X1 [Megalobrama amblycephala]
MIFFWTKMLLIFILFENAEGWNSSSDTVPNIIKLQALDMWRLEMAWTMNQKEEHKYQTYEIQVGRSTNMDIVDSMNVSRGPLDTVHTMVWTSQLPLNCVDHSVRIRLISDASPSSSWSLWKTNYGETNLAHNNEPRMFPDEQVLREGSTVMFCCIFPKETNITSMYFSNTEYRDVINISPQVKAIRVENIKATNLYGVNFYCKKNNPALNYFTFPPDKPQDFRCETKDMRNINCSWKIRRDTDLQVPLRRKYTLLISDSGAVSFNTESNPTSCSFEVIPQQINYNITLLVTNSLGQESETYIFNITKRVFPVPERLDVTAGVLDSVVVLQLNGTFKGLLLVCQIELEPGGTIQELDKDGSDSMQHYTFRLQHLKPSTQYSTRGRCAVQGNAWGQWTPQRQFNTKLLVTVDLWRRIRDVPNRTVTLVWKNVSSDAKSYIEVYEVCVSNSNPQRSVCMNVTQTNVELPLDIHKCDVTVRAVTQSGLSIPSHITIPSAYTAEILKKKRIKGNEKGFQLTWTRDSAATCDYIVEWCMLGSAPPCNLEWRKVPANQTSLNLNPEFTAGVQYTFTVYKCNAEGHRPHEKQIGYLKEQEPTQYPTLDSNPNITWSSVNLKWSFNEEDPSHAGFITRYVIKVQEDSEAGSDLISFKKHFLDDPHSKSFTVSGLKEDQPYTFHLAACTNAGCGPETTATFRTRKNYYLLMAKISIPLLVLVGCCVCLWLHRSMLRFPFGFLHIKALDLDEDLYEASEKIHSLRIEDCTWCDVEILDMPPTAAEKTWLASEEDLSCSFVSPKVALPSFLTPSCHLTADICAATGLTNLTYMSSVQQNVSSEVLETPETKATKQESEFSGFSSDYVTSVAT